MDNIKREELLRRINSVSWYNRFELLPGIMTPGRVPLDQKVVFQHYGLPDDLTGKKVLDVGTMDGAIAFACEARGAEVTALDIQDPDETAFNTAKSLLGSNVRYVRGSVYDAPKLLDDQYDYVLLLGVFYHLKHPILALERLQEVQPMGGHLIFEGECLLNYAEDAEGQIISGDALRRLLPSDVPFCAFYSGTFRGDDTNWFIPNPACLRGWFQAAGYRVIREMLHDVPSSQRIGGMAEKVSVPPIEHRVFLDRNAFAAVSVVKEMPQTGWWWNPAEGGRRFFIETRGNLLLMAAYLYDPSGRATWFAAGPTAMNGSTFSSMLTAYNGGQTLIGRYTAPTGTSDVGKISISFSDAGHGTLTWPGGTIRIQRYDIVPGGASATSPAGTPEAGCWWNSSESGRGFGLEVQNGVMFLAGYMYDTSGNPVWYASGPTAMTNATTYIGTWNQYGNGQTLTGTYQPATVVNRNVGQITIQFSDTQNGLLTLPDGRQIPITRFRF